MVLRKFTVIKWSRYLKRVSAIFNQNDFSKRKNTALDGLTNVHKNLFHMAKSKLKGYCIWETYIVAGSKGWDNVKQPHFELLP